MKAVLLISPEAWGQNFISKHHYAKELASRGYRVYFLNPPTQAFKCRQIEKNLIVVDYKPLFRGIGKLPKYFSGRLIVREITTLEKKINDKFDIIWNFDSSRFFNLSKLKEKLRICHIVDMAENIQRNLLAETSDVCFCTSDFIEEELLPFNRYVYKIHHGYKFPDEMFSIGDEFDSSIIQIGYVGNLTRSCIDWNLIFKLIETYPDAQFNFIGSTGKSNLSHNRIKGEYLDFLKGKPNVNLLGQKESNLIPSYLRKFDVLICAYKMESDVDLKQHSNLHKLMEYIGSENITVSTYVDEYKDKKELLGMAENTSDFLIKFNQVVGNVGFYNSTKLKQERMTFVLNNSYAKQLNKIEEYLRVIMLNKLK
jgi:hypothetical protein